MGRSESVFRMTTNEMYRPPFEPSRQEEFEHIVMNFILDQEKRVKQLEEYMEVIMGDFMQLSSKVTRRLKEKIIEEGSRMRKIKNITSPQSTPQVLPSIEENTPPVTYPEDIEETLGTPIEVEPLNETKLEEVGLNFNHNTPLSSREIPNFDGPEPQPLLNSPSLDIFDDDWRLESKEVSPLGEELSLFDRPNEVQRGRILEAQRLESILQQQISQRMAPSHRDGRKAHLLEDKQIPSVGVFDEVYLAFGGNTRDLGSFGEETDKTTDLHQHFSRLCSQRLETASPITRDAVTTYPMTLSQDLTMALARTTQPKI
ncbi:hypothetical protein Tco_1095405 [Tanacetum coccineum]